MARRILWNIYFAIISPCLIALGLKEVLPYAATLGNSAGAVAALATSYSLVLFGGIIAWWSWSAAAPRYSTLETKAIGVILGSSYVLIGTGTGFSAVLRIVGHL